MIRRIKQFVAVIALAFAVALPVAVTNNTSAQVIEHNICQGTSLGDFGGTGNCADNQGTDISSLVRTIINILSWVVGVLSIIMMIVGGFRFVTSGGDSNKVASARNTIVYALIGVVIAALAQVIVHFVLGNVTNANQSGGGAPAPSPTYGGSNGVCTYRLDQNGNAIFVSNPTGTSTCAMP